MLWFYFKKSLQTQLKPPEEKKPSLSDCGKLTAYGLFFVVFVMMTASALEWDLGLPTFLASFLIVARIAIRKQEWPKKVLKDIAWGVIPLVAGLFIIVEAMNQAGALKTTESFLQTFAPYPGVIGNLIAAFSVGTISNLINNLPVGLMSGMAVRHHQVSEGIRNAVLVGVDLGPNLSVTGSLATILWLMVLRREGEKISGFAFFKVGLIAMPIALAFAVIFIR